MGVNSGPFTASRASWADKVWPKIVGRFRRAVLARKRRLPSILPPPRLSQPIRDLLWFVLIGAVVGAVYGHMIAVSDGAPLLGFGGMPRGALTGVVITGALCSYSNRSGRDRRWHSCAGCRSCRISP